MPTRNSLSLISLGTPTSMGLTPKPRLRPTRGGYRRKLAVGTLALALHLSLCYKQGRLAAALEEPANLRAFRRGQRMNSIGRLKALTFAAAAALALGSADAGTLDKVRQGKAPRIASREDAPPFSFTDSSGLPAGFMIDLCGSVVKHIGEQLDISDLKISYVLVTAENRFDAIESGKADLLCEPTSATLSRREHVDFSIATFVDGASLLVAGDGPGDFGALSGKKIGVLAGATPWRAPALRPKSCLPKPTKRGSPCSIRGRSSPISPIGRSSLISPPKAATRASSVSPTIISLSNPTLWRCRMATRISGLQSIGR